MAAVTIIATDFDIWDTRTCPLRYRGACVRGLFPYKLFGCINSVYYVQSAYANNGMCQFFE